MTTRPRDGFYLGQIENRAAANPQTITFDANDRASVISAVGQFLKLAKGLMHVVHDRPAIQVEVIAVDPGLDVRRAELRELSQSEDKYVRESAKDALLTLERGKLEVGKRYLVTQGSFLDESRCYLVFQSRDVVGSIDDD